MGEEISSSKSFFITVVVLLALVIFVSYWGDSTAGQATRSQGLGNQESRCTTNWAEHCGSSVAKGNGGGSTEAAAKAASQLKCDQDKIKITKKYDRCLKDKKASCAVPFVHSSCKFDVTQVTNTLGSCVVKSCTFFIPNIDDDTGTSGGSGTECTFSYDQNGKRIDPPICQTYWGYYGAQWSCDSSDGGLTAIVTCHP